MEVQNNSFDQEVGKMRKKFLLDSMKKALLQFGQVLKEVLAGIAKLFAITFCMGDNSKYSRFLHRVVGSSFAFIMLVAAIWYGWNFCNMAVYRLRSDNNSDNSFYDRQYLSHNVSYYGDFGMDGYIETSDGKRTISGIRWIAKPLGQDSLVCYSDGKRRGYFNMFTGQPVIEPKYSHAWIFSDGLASVNDNGWIKFIDATGKVAIDLKIPYLPGAEGYVFHDGYCIIHDYRRDRFGVIDKYGKWILQPEFLSIESVDSFWVVDNGKGQSAIDYKQKTIIPYLDGRIFIGRDNIHVTFADHTIKLYNRQGKLTEDFFIKKIEHMTYETNELYYNTTKNYNDKGVLISEVNDTIPIPIKKTAKCLRYEAAVGWHGLISPQGKVITPPSYWTIDAIGYDMYLCKNEYDDGVILNGKGERIR